MNNSVIEKQRKFFKTKKTLDLNFRKKQIELLINSIKNNYDKIIKAFKNDFNKVEFDIISTELSLIFLEASLMIKKMNKFSKRKKVKTDIFNFPSKGYIYKEPLGNCLIISPWNYPLQLAFLPLIGAIAAGNTVILKPSEYSANVSLVIKDILSVFDEEYICLILGDSCVSEELLSYKFDLIFFTGSSRVGQIVMEAASKHLTPVILELGGKSPCIVDCDSDLDLSAKRIVWGKFLNAGQTCIAPDYLLVHKDIKSILLDKIIYYIKKFYYQNSILDSNFPEIITKEHLSKLINLMSGENIIFGGKFDVKSLEPTIVDNISFDSKIMQEEIFGPILPIIEFENLNSVIDKLNNLDKPLALYYFSKNKKKCEHVIKNCSFGGACINDTIMHVCNKNMPFGGVGLSGIGSYHGYKSFEVFSHFKSVLKKGKFELNIKYPPITNKKLKLLKFFSKIKK